MQRKILFSILALTSSVTSALETQTHPAATMVAATDGDKEDDNFAYNGKEIFTEWPNEELIPNHLDDQVAPLGAADKENTSNHPSLQGAHKLQVDRLCSSTNTVDNVCTIKDKTLRFSSDVFYKTNKTLVFDNSKVKCLTIDYTPCSFMVDLVGGADTFLELKNSSVVTGKQVIIAGKDSSIIIGEGSSVWASGQSLSSQGTKNKGIGASFIGQSGYCAPEGTTKDTSKMSTYGYFEQLPDFADLKDYTNAIGSIGKNKDVETAGGGRVVLIADSVTFTGSGAKVQANARPYSDFTARRYSLSGGSGGYIYIKTTNVNKQNSISKKSKIEARGGYGVGDYTSGSGGQVIFDGDFSLPASRVHVNGGIAQKSADSETGCANGAAGTVYYTKADNLVIDNKGFDVMAATTVTVPEVKQNPDREDHELVKKLVVSGNANLIIKGEHKGLMFDDLIVHDKSWVEFGQQDNALHILFNKNAQISKDSTLDFTRTRFATIKQAESDEVTQSVTTIGNVKFQKILAMYADNVNITGNITMTYMEGVPAKDTYVGVEAINIKIFENASIVAGVTLLHANDTIEMKEGSKIKSTDPHSCTTDKIAPDLYSCIGPAAQKSDRIEFTDIMGRLEEQFPTYGGIRDNMKFPNWWGAIRANYTVYLLSSGETKLSGAEISGARIGLCAASADVKKSSIDASGHGCPSDQGLGKGVKYSKCSGTGGSNGGSGGYGGLLLDTTNHSQSVCPQMKPEAYRYGLENKFEGSGGASGDSNARLGGSGGGIIRIDVLNEMKMSRSKVLANGNDGKDGGQTGSGGGAGGTISVTTRYLKGDAKFNVEGGNGSLGGGGGGAGGRLAVKFLSGFSFDSQPDQSHYWRGTFSLQGGKEGAVEADRGYAPAEAGQSGVVNSGKCFGGYSGPFCKPCETGTFKYDYSYSICQPCENKPVSSFYSSVGASTSDCAYECSSGLDPVSVNPYCKNALELQVSRLGGVISSLVVFSCFSILVLFIWIVLIIHSKMISRSGKTFRSTVYDGVLFTSDETEDPSEQMIGPKNLKMQDSDIWSHTHRMYLLGENSISFPWFIPKDFPVRALSATHKDKLIRMQKSRQESLNWTALQKDSYILTRILCPPVSNLIHRCFRKRHFNKLQDQLYETFDAKFWDSRNKAKTMRLSASTSDNQLAYIDFLDYEKSKRDYIGPQLPLTLMLAGSGTFNSPYFVNFEDDALAKSLVYFNKATMKDQLPLWFNNLNTILSKTSFFKLSNATIKDLSQVLEWIELGNKTLFNPLDTKVTLYLFENSYHSVESGTFKQRRRSFPMELIAFEAFPDLLQNLIRFVKTKLMGRKSEIRFGLVFKPLNEAQRRKLHDRIRRITQAQRQTTDRQEQWRPEENLIFGSDDDDSNDDSFSYTKSRLNVMQGTGKGKSTMGAIRRGEMAESTTELLSETNMESSEVFIYGDGGSAKQVKIVDKSKRAFDLSNDAVKSLELALLKPRTSCKHKMLRFRAFWYGLWILFFKHHGIPPKSGTRYQYFFGFALFIALDVLLTINVCFHMFNPLDNWKTFGIPYFFVTPGVTVLGPLMGIIACLLGSPRMLKMQASVNATAVILNYPITLAVMIGQNDEPFYIALIVLLWFNKITLSYFGAKVRQHLINPGFTKNITKIEERFNTYTQVVKEIDAGVKSGMSPAERASSLASAGPPAIALESDEEEEEEEDPQDQDDTSYGIIPKNRLEDDKVQISD